MAKINVDELRLITKEGVAEGSIIVDIRNEEEYELASIPQSINIPMGTLADNIEKLSAYKNIYVYCNTDARSSDACSTLMATGLSNNIVCVEGGISAWMANENEVSGSRRVLPMLQQVHLAASTFVLVPTLLALFVDVRFAWITVIPGLGLLGSGLTGFCGITYIFGKMPWNR